MLAPLHHDIPHRSAARDARPRRVLAATILGSGMAFIDGSVVNVALPAMQSGLHASVGAMQWVVNAYLLLLSALVLIGGALGDRLGRVRVFAAGLVVFTAASIGCGVAPGTAVLIVARAVQGVGGALLVPNSLAIIGAAFAPEQRGRAIGTWSGAAALTTALGPVLGGWLVDAVSWRAVFLINVPLAVAALWLTAGLAESRDEAAAGRPDWAGAALAVAGFASLTFGFVAAPAAGFADAKVFGSIGLGVALLVAFVWTEGRISAPMVPLEMFRSRDFSGANLLTVLLYFALYGVLFFLPYTLIRGRGESAAAAGASLLPLSLLLGTLSRAAGRFADRVGARLPLVVGPLLAAAGFVLLGLRIAEPSFWSGLLPGLLLLGFGLTAAVAPLTATVMGSAGGQHAGIASGINNAVSRVAGLLAVAVLGLVFLAYGGGSDAPAGLLAGFRAVAWAGAGCAAASAIAAWLLIGRDGPTR